MSKWNWDTDRNEASNVSVNDGVVTYFAEWDTDENGAIDLRQVWNSFAATYDHNGERGVVEIEVENLITGETLTDEIECDLDEYDEDDEDEDDEEEE